MVKLKDIEVNGEVGCLPYEEKKRLLDNITAYRKNYKRFYAVRLAVQLIAEAIVIAPFGLALVLAHNDLFFPASHLSQSFFQACFFIMCTLGVAACFIVNIYTGREYRYECMRLEVYQSDVKRYIKRDEEQGLTEGIVVPAWTSSSNMNK